MGLGESIMDEIETILANNLFDDQIYGKFQELNWSLHEDQIKSQRYDFWIQFSSLYSDFSIYDEKLLKKLANYRKIFNKNPKTYKTELNVLKELQLYLNLRKNSFFTDKFTKNRKLKDLENIYEYYSEKGLICRKNQCLYRLSKIYLTSNNSKLAFQKFKTLILSLKDANYPRTISWAQLSLQVEFREYLEIEFINIIIELFPEIFTEKRYYDRLNIDRLKTHIIESIYKENNINDLNIIELIKTGSFFNLRDKKLFNRIKEEMRNKGLENIQNELKKLFLPPISTTFNFFKFLLVNADFFISLEVDQETGSNIFNMFSEINEINKYEFFSYLFSKIQKLEPKVYLKILLYFKNDLKSNQIYKKLFLDSLHEFFNSNIDLSYFENLISIAKELNLLKEELKPIVNQITCNFRLNSLNESKLFKFIQDSNIENIFYLQNFPDMVSMFKTYISKITIDISTITFYYRLKYALMTNFELFIDKNNFNDYLETFIEKSLADNPGPYDLLNYLTIFKALLKNSEIFGLHDINNETIKEILEILSTFKNSLNKQNHFSITKFVSEFGTLFKEKKCLNYLLSINKYAIKGILPTESSINNTIINEYLTILEQIKESFKDVDEKTYYEIQQIKVDFSNYYKNTFVESFLILPSNYYGLFSDINQISSAFLKDSLPKEVNKANFVGILNGINNILSNSFNMPTIFYTNGTKVFSKIHYLGLFDLVCNLIYKHGNPTNEIKKEILKTKLYLLRALTHISGISFCDCVDKSLKLINYFKQNLDISDDEIVEITRATPWKYTILEEKILYENEIKEITPLYGLYTEKRMKKIAKLKDFSCEIDIGLSFNNYRSKEKEFFQKISNEIKFISNSPMDGI